MFRTGKGIWKTGALTLSVAATGAAVSAAPSYAAAPVSSDRLGFNFIQAPSDLATASSAGAGLARKEVIEGSDTDSTVTIAAAAHLRLYPMLGLPTSHGAAADAVEMATFVVSFEQKYGPHGNFWQAHPELPYLPVESYEIGNEPDITPTHPQDEVSLHYSNPSDYAIVYETARTALHQVDPEATAVVGGMLDSGQIPLSEAERYLDAIGPMDAVGFHPYLYDLGEMERDTETMRQWLDSHGHANVPLDINEFGAFKGTDGAPAIWGEDVARYTDWALCTPSLHVEDVQPFWWGSVPSAATDEWYSMVDANGNETPVGAQYLNEVKTLTTQGCPSPGPEAKTAHLARAPSLASTARASKHQQRRSSKRHRKRRHRRSKR
jgi:hypothetical protein